MRILAISDSHRNTRVIRKILSAQDEARHIFFLGDNVSDIEGLESDYPSKIFHVVCGNCDYGSFKPTADMEIIDNVKIFYTHGHTYNVKSGTVGLQEAAKSRNCQIALYGHTHVSKTVYDEGLWIVNPGSCSCPRDGSKPSYAVIDITPGGIMPFIVEL